MSDYNPEEIERKWQRHWADRREFEVTEDQLRRAVGAVGPNPERVRRFLTLSWMLARQAPRLGRSEAGA